MFDTNPTQIQHLPSAQSHQQPPPTPLVLIHDGGGTVYSYHCLGPLSRPVYGIHNPHYGTSLSFRGGIPEMARHYISLIRTIFPNGGDIILGGWSLGGLLSLEMVRLLAGDKGGLRVLGIVMIDSIYPRSQSGLGTRVVPHAVEWAATTRRETREAVERCFEEAGRMVREWEMPTWEGMAAGPPPVWLLRATEPVPVLEEGGVSKVDTYREDRYLGWERYREGMVVKVEDVPGHHFNIFSFQDGHIDAVTDKLKTVCLEVERRARRGNVGDTEEARR